MQMKMEPMKIQEKILPSGRAILKISPPDRQPGQPDVTIADIQARLESRGLINNPPYRIDFTLIISEAHPDPRDPRFKAYFMIDNPSVQLRLLTTLVPSSLKRLHLRPDDFFSEIAPFEQQDELHIMCWKIAANLTHETCSIADMRHLMLANEQIAECMKQEVSQFFVDFTILERRVEKIANLYNLQLKLNEIKGSDFLPIEGITAKDLLTPRYLQVYACLNHFLEKEISEQTTSYLNSASSRIKGFFGSKPVASERKQSPIEIGLSSIRDKILHLFPVISRVEKHQLERYHAESEKNYQTRFSAASGGAAATKASP